MQLLAGNAAGARVTGQAARNILEQLRKDQPKDVFTAINLSEIYAVMGQKDLALETAEQALVQGRAQMDPLAERTIREHMAAVQATVGENSRAISILAELLQQPYWSYFYGPPAITRAHLRLDPIWDPLRSDPAFQKLCEEKKP
jgi:predicted Zn-dependent protease